MVFTKNEIPFFRCAALVAGALLWLSFPAVVRAHEGLQADIARVTSQLKEEPVRADLLIARGRLYRLSGKLLASLADLNRARKINADDSHVALQRGLTLSALRRDTEAEAELSRCVTSDRPLASAFAERARIRVRRDRKESAIADFTAAIRIKPHVELYLARGRLQEDRGNLDTAASGYREGLTRLNGAVLLRLALIRTETQRRQYDRALALIEPALSQARVKTDWYRRRAEIHAAAGEPTKARDDLRLALAEADRVLTSRATSIHLLSRARVYTALGRHEEAIQDARNALEKTPRFEEADHLLRQLTRSTNGRKTTSAVPSEDDSHDPPRI